MTCGTTGATRISGTFHVLWTLQQKKISRTPCLEAAHKQRNIAAAWQCRYSADAACPLADWQITHVDLSTRNVSIQYKEISKKIFGISRPASTARAKTCCTLVTSITGPMSHRLMRFYNRREPRLEPRKCERGIKLNMTNTRWSDVLTELNAKPHRHVGGIYNADKMLTAYTTDTVTGIPYYEDNIYTGVNIGVNFLQIVGAHGSSPLLPPLPSPSLPFM